MTVSVAICTYNGEDFITQQIESIINQSRLVDEIIICDDMSTDATIQILTKFQLKFPSIIKIYQNEKKLGVIKNFEKAINLCNGKLIFLSDQDDIWYFEKVEKIIHYFNTNSSKKAVFHNLDLQKENQLLSFTNWDSIYFRTEHLKELSLLHRLVLMGNFVTGASLAFKNQNHPIKFTIARNLYHDFQLALSFAEKNQLGLIKESLGIYRLHSNQQVGIKSSSTRKETYELIQSNNRSKEKMMFLDKALTFWDIELDFVEKNLFINIIKPLLIEAKNNYLHELSFFERKIKIASWILRKKYFTTFKDFITN